MAVDIYQMLAGSMPPLPQRPPRPGAMELWQEALQGARNEEVPLANAAWEQGQQGMAMGGMATDALATAFGQAAGGLPGQMEQAWADAALSHTGTTDTLGANVGAPMQSYADNVYASLAGAGQDTGVADTLRQIGERSGRVLDAIGAGSIENMLNQQIAAGKYGRELMSIGQSGLTGQGQGFQSAVRTANSQGPDMGPAQNRFWDDLSGGLQSRQESDIEWAKLEQQQRENIMSLSMRALEGLRGDDRAVLEDERDYARDVYEDERDFTYDLSQDQAAAAQDAADAASGRWEEKAKRREDARRAVQDTLDALNAEALSLAEQLAKGYDVSVPRTDEAGNPLSPETEQRPHSAREAYERILSQLKVRFASQIRRGAIREKRLREIARAAVASMRGDFTGGAQSLVPGDRPGGPQGGY